jgi:hypothetical protein
MSAEIMVLDPNVEEGMFSQPRRGRLVKRRRLGIESISERRVGIKRIESPPGTHLFSRHSQETGQSSTNLLIEHHTFFTRQLHLVLSR